MKRGYFLKCILIICLLTLAGCGSSSDSGGGSSSGGSSGDASETFTNGGVTLSASLAESGNTKTSTITNAAGETVVTAAVTTTGVTLTFPGQSEQNTTTFTEPLSTMPSNHAVNMLATYIAGQLTLSEASAQRCDSPGCDWFPDTQCTLGCCADHDSCYDENGCGASSWLLVGASTACINCNGIAEACILRACSGVDSSRTEDRCYDNRCHEFYDCGEANCTCTSPCDSVSPSGCGNGTCEVDEDQSNCPGDCVDGAGLNQCCVTHSDCPTETAYTCPGNCCCCGYGEVCSTSTHLCAAASVSAAVKDYPDAGKWGPAVGE